MGFASLLLGISMALMLYGSVTFLIGFMLMPWVLGLVMVFYVVGIVSKLSLLVRFLLYFLTPRKDVPGPRVMALAREVSDDLPTLEPSVTYSRDFPRLFVNYINASSKLPTAWPSISSVSKQSLQGIISTETKCNSE
ncbi:hypothetical protein PIB30_079931 [Stylosanthes scabra]|uniref:Uncharacterized protein n=1 Tax=Stylosanthes scabra TaxID=79078 RepID=A0ABU6WPJ8_9FABA|nr:hypothetical protein [Stylosanthes scabra]